VRNYLRYIFLSVHAVYVPDPGDGLPDYVTNPACVGRSNEELATRFEELKTFYHNFDPYPGFTYTDNWTFTPSDAIKAYFVLDHANFYFLLNSLPDFFYTEAVTQPPELQLIQVLLKSPRKTGWVDRDGVRHEPTG
jgi:hypothetical protein